ncbi:MAG: hypothetical protein IPL26_19680 [Leptospiraceae bacterium]|nr:hypothetical protein [Leptospiraceae bacterium]
MTIKNKLDLLVKNPKNGYLEEINKTSEVAVEAITKLNEAIALLHTVKDMDADYLASLRFHAKGLKRSVFGHIIKYEYSDLYLKHKKKLNELKFIKNPKRLLQEFKKLSV